MGFLFCVLKFSQSTVSKIKDALVVEGIRILDDQTEGGYTITVSQMAVEVLQTSLQTRRDNKENASRDAE